MRPVHLIHILKLRTDHFPFYFYHLHRRAAQASKGDNTHTRKPRPLHPLSLDISSIVDMAALNNAAAMDASHQQQEDAFAAFRNAKHDPARREVSVVCVWFVLVKRRWGGHRGGHYFFILPNKGSEV